MTSDAQKLLKIQNIVNQMIANGESTDYIDNFLAQQGETPDSIAAINRFGAEGVANVRKSNEEFERSKPMRQVKAFIESVPAGERAFSDVVVSMGEEALKDATAGLYGNKWGKEGYERRKQALKEEALRGGYYPLETTARGMSGLAGQVASPIYKAAMLIPGVGQSMLANSLIGPAAYQGIKKYTEGGDALDIAESAAGGAIAGGAGYVAGKMLNKILSKGSGALSGTGSETVDDIVDAGARDSDAFKAGRKMSDYEFSKTMAEKTAGVKKAATDAFAKGKEAISDMPINKGQLFSDYQNAYAEHVSPGGLVDEQANKVYKQAQGMIRKFEKIKKPTVADLHILKRNIGGIDAVPGSLAEQARTELYDITRNAADAATSGQYGQVMEPYAEIVNSLRGISKNPKTNPDWSAQTSAILRKMRTDFGKETFKQLLGQDTYDMILGKLTATPISSRTGMLTALGAIFSGNLPQAVAFGGLTSPRIVGDAAFWIGKNAPTLAETIGPVASAASDFVNPAKLLMP